MYFVKWKSPRLQKEILEAFPRKTLAEDYLQMLAENFHVLAETDAHQNVRNIIRKALISRWVKFRYQGDLYEVSCWTM